MGEAIVVGGSQKPAALARGRARVEEAGGPKGETGDAHVGPWQRDLVHRMICSAGPEVRRRAGPRRTGAASRLPAKLRRPKRRRTTEASTVQ